MKFKRLKEIDGWCLLIPKRLSGRELKVATNWMRHSENYHPSIKQISDETGLHKSHVSTTLKNLVDMKILEKTGNKYNPGKRPTPKFCIHPDLMAEIESYVNDNPISIDKVDKKIILKKKDDDWVSMPKEEMIPEGSVEIPERKDDKVFLKAIGVEDVYE